jgi:hypothetical protein
MYNRPHKQNMWCANALVGAPWACGEARYDESVENYKHDVTNSYEGFVDTSCSSCSNTACGDNMDRMRNDKKCGNWDHKGAQCKQGYETAATVGDDKINRLCNYNKKKCTPDNSRFCSTSDYCKKCDAAKAADTTTTPTPTGGGGTPLPGGVSGTASTTFYGTQANGEVKDNYLNKGLDSSCGCNTKEEGANVLSDWYNAAVNDTLFGVNTNTTTNETDWNCGSGCGRCFELTTTGKRADNASWTPNPDEGQTIKVVATNMCPNYYNDWCALPGTTNGDFISTNFGGTGAYEYHFDLQNSFSYGDTPTPDDGSWLGCKGTSCNAEVQFQEIVCPDYVKTALKNNCKGTDPVDWAVAKEGCKYS